MTYDEAYAQELANLHKHWQGIPEERLEYWAEQITNKKCKI